MYQGRYFKRTGDTWGPLAHAAVSCASPAPEPPSHSRGLPRIFVSLIRHCPSLRILIPLGVYFSDAPLSQDVGM